MASVGGGIGPWWRRPLVVDVVLAVATAVTVSMTTTAAMNDPDERLDLRGHLLVAFTSAWLVAWRRSPLTCLAGTFVSTLVYLWVGYPLGPIFLVVAIAMAAIGLYCRTKVAWIACAIMVVFHAVLITIVMDTDEDGPPLPAELAITTTWLILPTATGIAIRVASQARLRAREAERRRTVADARLSMSREVHDVVGHSLAVISMHAGVALHVIDRRGVDTPPEVVESLETIRRSGAEALDELRATLNSTGMPDQVDRRPGYGLDDIGELIAGIDSVGLQVELRVDGEADGVPAAVQTAGYRIVQESLTNVVKHAAANRADVRLAVTPGLVTVIVVDDGRGGTVHGDRCRGIPGMAERASGLGGTFSAGPAAGGGFAVRAELPYATVGVQ